MPDARTLARLVVFAGLTMFVVDCSYGQVVIQERVEVDPAVTIEGPISNAGALLGWQFNMPGRLIVDFSMIDIDALHCGTPLSIWNPRLEFRYSGSRDTVITVPLVPYIVSEQNPPTSCDLWLIALEGGFDLGVIESGDRVEPLYLVHGYEVPLRTEVLVPDDTQDNGGGTYLWYADHYISTEDNEPYYDHLYETLGYVVVLEPVLHHLFVVAQPDTLAVDEAAVLSLEGRQEDEAPVGLPTGATLDLALDQGGGTIGFLRWNGVEGVVLTGVPAVDIEAGLVEIVASETGPPTLTREDGAGGLKQRQSLSENTPPSASNMAGETTLTITAALSDSPSVTGSTTVTITVGTPTLALTFELNASVINPAAYLPTKDDIIEVTAALIGGPPDAVGDVTFSLPEHYEFEFDGAGSTPQMVALVNGEAKVSLRSLTWWGVATVQADFDLSGQPLMAEQQIPVDTDGDTIADKWEDDNGGRSLGGNPDDRDWDEEAAPIYAGDKFTKLAEYMGFIVGSQHLRTDPFDDRDMFVNVAAAPTSGGFASSGMQQLGVVVEDVGLDLTYSLEAGLSEPIVAVSRELARTHSSVDTGIYYQGIPTALVQNVEPTLGWSEVYQDGQGQHRFGIGRAIVYMQTIDNFYNHNSVPEAFGSFAVPEAIYWEVPSTQSVSNPGKQIYIAVFDGSDLDPRPGITDVNPFDIAGDHVVNRPNPIPGGLDIATSQGNNPADGEIAGMTQAEAVSRTSRHELGHLAGLPHPCGTSGRMCTEATVMRQGIGPAKVDDFNADDVQSSRIK